jgi:hypothetical protein
VKLSCGLLSGLLVAFPASAYAVVIFPPPPPPPGALPPVQFYDTYIGVAGSGPYPLTAPGEAQVPAGAQGGTGHVIVSLLPSPDVYLDFDNTQAVGGLAGGGGLIDMTYSAMYYNAALPMYNQGNPVVKVALLAEDFVSQMGAGTVTVVLSVDEYTNHGTSFGYAVFDRQCVTSSSPSFAACGLVTPDAPFPLVQPFQMTENTVYTVELQVYALGGWNVATGAGGATGNIDPIISIDPSSADAGGGLFFSAGVGNGAVPEPSTWALMLAGFAALGFAYRVRRRAPAAH